ncbi:Uncharacterised protein at_DN1629 [Pycnogonum litorale]
MRRIAVRSPMSSSSKIRSALLAKGTDVSRRTVSRRLVDYFGLKSFKPARKPRLTLAMKVKRLAFAKKHANWTIQQWLQVFFRTNRPYSSSTHVRGMSVDQLEKDLMSDTPYKHMKHPPSVMIWGGISVNGTAGLFFLPSGTTMNGQKYVDLLKNKLELHMAIHKCKIIMQDGAPCHRSKIVTQFLKSKKIQILDWLGNSSDLNPIENLWSILKNKVADNSQVVPRCWKKQSKMSGCMKSELNIAETSGGGHQI